MIEKLNINLFPDDLIDVYNQKKADYITNWHNIGFWGNKIYDPIKGEASWNTKYPNGYDSWAKDYMKLTSIGQQNVIDKLNEIIEKINEFDLKGGEQK